MIAKLSGIWHRPNKWAISFKMAFSPTIWRLIRNESFLIFRFLLSFRDSGWGWPPLLLLLNYRKCQKLIRILHSSAQFYFQASIRTNRINHRAMLDYSLLIVIRSFEQIQFYWRERARTLVSICAFVTRPELQYAYQSSLLMFSMRVCKLLHQCCAYIA